MPVQHEDIAAENHFPARPRAGILNTARMRYAATLLALLGIGLSVGVPFALGAHAILAGLRILAPHVFLILVASAALSGAAKAGKLQLLQTALGLRLRFRHTLAMTVVTDSAFLVSPLGAAGYGVNVALLSRAGATWALATTVVGADQVLDLVFFGVAIPIGLVFALGPLAKIFPQVSALMVIGSLFGAVLLACLLWVNRKRAAAALNAIGRRIPWLKSRREQWHLFHQNMRMQLVLLITGLRWRFLALLLLTTVQWLLRYSALWFSLLELGYRLPLGFVLAVQAVVLHLALWTGVPAGGGGGDLALAAVFTPWVPPAAMAMALVLWRFATLYCPLILGVAGFAALGWRRKLSMPRST